jgi:hypothetical protein
MAVFRDAAWSAVMIHVQLQPEPASFDAEVRIPGRRFIERRANPTAKEWKARAYWTRVLEELHNVYQGICAYSCHWIPYDTGHDTVEHFKPKQVFPREAYEWSNYRLVCGTLNGRKGTDQGILDPFCVQDGWFVLDFPSLLVKPNRTLPNAETQSVLHTIGRLGLNDEGTCLKARLRYVKCYCLREVSFRYLENEAPFIAREIRRQGLVRSLKALMG